MDEVRSFDILKNLNHIWLIHEGRHFDGATPNGAESIFDLRLVRQVAVELIRRNSPERMATLSEAYDYWRESEVIFDEYITALAREVDCPPACKM